MKKLMIAAAIVCAAVYAQAACSLGWMGGNDIYFVNSNGEYLYDTADLVLVNLGQTINWDNASIIPSTTKTSPDDGTTTLKNNDSVISGKVKWTWHGEGEDLINDGDYVALMFKDSEGKLQKLSYYNNGEITEVGNEAVYQVTGVNNNSFSRTGAVIGLTGDFTQAVPEPTSGLLLLLGVAGLALRRRRA